MDKIDFSVPVITPTPIPAPTPTPILAQTPIQLPITKEGGVTINLNIYFDDIRPEDYRPSHAGTSPRIDFFLKNEQIIIETKITSKNHSKKKIAQELIIDKEYYGQKNYCKILYCLVYDPEARITNPSGFESDLYEKRENFEAKVFVVPRLSLHIPK